MAYTCTYCDHRILAQVERCPGCGKSPWREHAIPRISYDGDPRRDDGKGKAIFQFNSLVIQNGNGRIDRVAYADLVEKYGEYVYKVGRYSDWDFLALPSKSPTAIVAGFPPARGGDSYDRGIQAFNAWLQFYVDLLRPSKTVVRERLQEEASNKSEGQDTMFCMKCGQQLPDDANFCLRCGMGQKEGLADSSQVPLPSQTKSLSAGNDVEVLIGNGKILWRNTLSGQVLEQVFLRDIRTFEPHIGFMTKKLVLRTTDPFTQPPYMGIGIYCKSKEQVHAIAKALSDALTHSGRLPL